MNKLFILILLIAFSFTSMAQNKDSKINKLSKDVIQMLESVNFSEMGTEDRKDLRRSLIEAKFILEDYTDSDTTQPSKYYCDGRVLHSFPNTSIKALGQLYYLQRCC